MSAAKHDLDIEQGATKVFQLKFIKDGVSLPITDIEFEGTVKASIYDTEGYAFRFNKVGTAIVDVYLDATVSQAIDFKKGVYDITMKQVDGFVTRLLEGNVTNTLGVS